MHKWALPIVAFAFFRSYALVSSSLEVVVKPHFVLSSAFVGVIGSLFSVVVNYLVSLGLSTTLVGLSILKQKSDNIPTHGFIIVRSFLRIRKCWEIFERLVCIKIPAWPRKSP